MAAEIWDLYDGCGEKTGRTMVRGEAIPTGFYHIGVHIWPMNGRPSRSSCPFWMTHLSNNLKQ